MWWVSNAFSICFLSFLTPNESASFAVSSYARELYSKDSLFGDVFSIKAKIEKVKKDVDYIIKSRKECANLDFVEEIKNFIESCENNA